MLNKYLAKKPLPPVAKEDTFYGAKIVNALMKDSLPVIMYGAEYNAHCTAQYLTENHIRLHCFIIDDEYANDKSTETIEEKEYSINTYSEYMQNELPSYNVVISWGNYSKAKEVIANAKLIFPKANDIHYLNISKTIDYKHYLEHADAYQHSFDLLSDDISREIYAGYIKSGILGNPEPLDEFVEESGNLFDYRLLGVDESETFIDCGAYNGDSVLDFIKYTKGKYEKIYAIEPNPKSYAGLTSSLRAYHNIVFLNKGVYDSNGILRFDSLHSEGSSISVQGDAKIDVSALDDIVEDHVSFIKYNVEGVEINALSGSKRLICQCRPKVVISLFHKPEDLFGIPRHFTTLFPNYKLYIRQRNTAFEGTFLYAIPN